MIPVPRGHVPSDPTLAEHLHPVTTTASPQGHPGRVQWPEQPQQLGDRMTGNDLFAAAPWILFGVALAAVCLLLLSEQGSKPGRPSAFRRPLLPDWLRRRGRR
jgi:hypothetical protein